MDIQAKKETLPKRQRRKDAKRWFLHLQGELMKENQDRITALKIPYEKLEPETLQALIEEFVSRDGTDYGRTEVPFEQKVAQVKRL